MKTFLKASLMTSLVVGLMALTASGTKAAPFLVGDYSISGNLLAVNGSTGAPASLDTATGLDFINLAGGAASPGAPGQFLVNNATGNFAGILGMTGAIKDFSFAGPGSGNFPAALPILAFESVGGLTFDLSTIAIQFQGPNALLLNGTGIFHFAGFDPTPGTFVFSANQGTATFSFSASHVAAPIPEPASMLLLGTGLAGVAGLVRRKLKTRNLN